MKIITHINKHMVYNFNPDHIIKMIYNTHTSKLYLHLTTGEKFEVESITVDEYGSLINDLQGSDVN